jgi:tRNA pseudouridine13 synthase
VTAASDAVRARGFINYFGLQRFGTSSIATHRVGRALLRRDYALAVFLILAPRGASERPEITAVRERLMRAPRDIGAALAALPPKS